MFHDPRRDLQWLEDALLEEEREEGFLEEDEEYGEDFEGEPEDNEDDLAPGTNPAVDFGRAVYDDEDTLEGRALLYEKRRKGKKKKDKGIRGLKFLAVLEVLAILAILGWWVLWLN